MSTIDKLISDYEPIVLVKYSPSGTIWQKIGRFFRWIFGLPNPIISTGKLVFKGEELSIVPINEGIIDMLPPPSDESTIGDVMEKINSSAEWDLNDLRKV